MIDFDYLDINNTNDGYMLVYYNSWCQPESIARETGIDEDYYRNVLESFGAKKIMNTWIFLKKEDAEAAMVCLKILED